MVLQLREGPTWGGFLRQLVKSLTTIGRAKLSYDELVTVVTEAEMILNCRPISYVASKDQKEPLTPYHLIVSRRLSALPEIDSPADADFRISPDDLSRRARHLDMILTHFWKR